MTDKSSGGARLGIDFGTSHTVAVLGGGEQASRALLFEGSPLLPSAVFAEADELVAGRFALQHGRRAPALLEPHPKRRVDLDSILLGAREIAIVEAVAAVLTRVRVEAQRVAGALAAVTITVPATWGPTRRQVVADAAARAGLGKVLLVPEPVAAAAYFVRRLGHRIEDGQAIVVYDLGAGTFDASVVARSGDGFGVLAQDGRDDLGGLDIDAAIVQHLQSHYAGIDSALDPAARARERIALLEEVRLAKESLSTYTRAEFAIPGGDVDAHLTRGELEDLARPMLLQTLKVTRAVIAAAGLTPERTAGVFLVGGASRMPVVATLLHQSLGIAPTAIEQPELVVAEGAVIAEPADAASPPRAPSTVAPPGASSLDYRPSVPAVGAGVPPESALGGAPLGPGQRLPLPVAVAAILLALLAMPLMSMWGGALETGIREGQLYSVGTEMLYGASYGIMSVAMLGSVTAAPLLLRRIRWARALGIGTAVAAGFPVAAALPSFLGDGQVFLGLVMIAVSVTAAVCLSQPGPRNWFTTRPNAASTKPVAVGVLISAGLVAGLATITVVLMAVLNEADRATFW